MVKIQQTERVVWLVAVGIIHTLWNSLGMRSVLLRLSPEPSDELRPFSLWQQRLFFTGQFLLAFACKWLALDWNPLGVLFWFWLPVATYAVLLPRRFITSVLIALVSIVINTAQEYARHGSHSAMLLGLAHFTGAF